MSLSSLAFVFCPLLGCVVVRASINAAVSFVRGFCSLPGSAFSSVPGVHGLGNFPGQSLGTPLRPAFPRLPSLSTTCAPNLTDLRPLLAVPGVIRMPPGSLDGETGAASSLGKANVGTFGRARSGDGFFCSFLLALFVSSGAGVPKTARFRAFTANWCAGVSGASMKVFS